MYVRPLTDHVTIVTDHVRPLTDHVTIVTDHVTIVILTSFDPPQVPSCEAVRTCAVSASCRSPEAEREVETSPPSYRRSRHSLTRYIHTLCTSSSMRWALIRVLSCLYGVGTN